MPISTADLYDAHETSVQVAEPLYRDFGGVKAFAGRVATVKVFEDNSLVRAELEKPGLARVLVVDGGGSTRCALLGDNLAELAVKNGWSGIVVHGCVRDTRALSELSLGVKALASNPRKSVKRGEGETGVLVIFAGLTVHEGDWLYADEDGILVSSSELSG